MSIEHHCVSRNLISSTEKDRNNDVLWTWSYPSVTPEQREFLIAKSGLSGENALSVNFLYSQWNQIWYYILIVDVTPEDAALSQVMIYTAIFYLS